MLITLLFEWRQLYDLEWKHAVDAAKAETSSKNPSKGFATAEGDAVDLGPMFAKRVKQDLRSVDQSVNLMEHNHNDRDSLDGTSQRSTRSTKSRTSVGRMSLVAPVRPHKFATRPSHVSIRMDDLITDESLIGVVEGRAGHLNRSNSPTGTPDVSNTEALDPSKRKQTALDRTKVVFVLLLKIMVVVAFIAYGVYVNLQFNEFTPRATSIGEAVTTKETTSRVEATLTAEIQPPAEAISTVEATKSIHQVNGDGRTGEIQKDVATSNVYQGSHESAHTVQHPPSPAPPDLIIGELASIILRHEVSLPDVLGGEEKVDKDTLNPQKRSLIWLAQSGTLANAEESRDFQFERLLQRYALAVLYYSLGGHQQQPAEQHSPPLVELEVSRIEREIHTFSPGDTVKSNSPGWLRKSKWMSDTSVCEWYGIKCNDDDMVVSLNLTRNGLNGQLPILEVFQALRTSLKCFDVSHNTISGSLSLPMSASMKPWAQLEYFFVQDNQITGSPPFAWFNMPPENPLLGINMARNKFSGGLANAGISNFEALKELYLSYNRLDGTLPSLSNLPSLGKFSLPIRYSHQRVSLPKSRFPIHRSFRGPSLEQQHVLGRHSKRDIPSHFAG
jgi:hypothetical protein